MEDRAQQPKRSVMSTMVNRSKTEFSSLAHFLPYCNDVSSVVSRLMYQEKRESTAEDDFKLLLFLAEAETKSMSTRTYYSSGHVCAIVQGRDDVFFFLHTHTNMHIPILSAKLQTCHFVVHAECTSLLFSGAVAKSVQTEDNTFPSSSHPGREVATQEVVRLP